MPETTTLNPEVSVHSLTGRDDIACYNVMVAERAILIQAKREEEQSLVKHIVTLSAGTVVLVSGLIFNKDTDFHDFRIVHLLIIGIIFALLSLICCLVEQVLSAAAYERQMEINKKYYGKISEITSNPLSKRLTVLIRTSLLTFFLSLVLLSSFLILNSSGNYPKMSRITQRPPPPRPPSEPSHKGDVPGRSVPPSPPPPPPSK